MSEPELQIHSPQSSPLLKRREAGEIPSITDAMSLTTTCRDMAAFLSLAITIFCVTSCATGSRHEFSERTTGWQTKTGQLMYRSAKTTLLGDVLVRFSRTGDFELTVSKGPGITLLSLRQDATFAKINGAFAHRGWSGPVALAPPQLHGWLALRDQFIRAPNQKILRYVASNETFLFRF